MCFPKGVLLVWTQGTQLIQGQVKIESQPADPGQTPCPSLFFLTDVCQSSVTHTDSSLRMEGQGGHMSTHVRTHGQCVCAQV